MDPSVIEEFENTFAFEDTDTDVKVLKTLDAVDFVNCFVEESPLMFDNTVFTEDDILEDCAKLETDASSDEDATEEVTASDTVDDMRSVLLVDKVTVGIAEDGVIGRIVEDGVRDDISDDNETDEEIADNC